MQLYLDISTQETGCTGIPHVPFVEVERAIIEQFIDGLTDDQTCCHLWLHKPVTLERCFILACDMEQCYTQESQRPISISQHPHVKKKSVSFQVGYDLVELKPTLQASPPLMPPLKMLPMFMT